MLQFCPAPPLFVLCFFLALTLEGCQGAVGCGFWFVSLLFEVFVVPQVGIERSITDGAGVEDDFMVMGLESGHAQVATRGLKSVEQEAGGFVVDLLGDEQADYLHERDLNGVGVFEDGEFEGRNTAAGAVGGEFDPLVLKAFVEKAETVAAQGGRSALSAVDFEMLTTIWIIRHWFCPPPPSPLGLLESSG